MKGALLKLVLIIFVSVLSGYLGYVALEKRSSSGDGFDREGAHSKAVGTQDLLGFIQNIEAPSGNLGANLLIDGVEADVNAWHAPVNPQYPVSIDVTFQKPVLMKKIAFQAQYGPPGNFQRAPKEIKVYGGESLDKLKELGALSLAFETVGSWDQRDIPKHKSKYSHYRIEILSNQGSPDYLTLQELKFYGEA